MFTISAVLYRLFLRQFVAGSVGVLVGGASPPSPAVEHVPAGGHDQHLFQTGEGESIFVDQFVDSFDLENVEVGVDPVVRALDSKGFDQTFFFVFPDPLLRKVHSA